MDKKSKEVDMESLSNSATHLRGSGDYSDEQDHIYQEIFTPPSVSHQRQDYMSLEEIRSIQNSSGKKTGQYAHIHIARPKTDGK